jgi:GT2 family glycosyltransferase
MSELVLKRYAVVILNWNGWTDTIECLKSVFEHSEMAYCILVDNGSTDDSIERITNWAKSTEVSYVSLKHDQEFSGVDISNTELVVLETGDNLGFAKGCNLGFRWAKDHGFSHVVFLNNDTIVWPLALDNIVAYLIEFPHVYATLPLLAVASTGRIWNCGGSISRMGFRRYFFAGADVEEVREKHDLISCSFFTGCCFAIRSEEFAERGGFCERFFFGEEDFELSMWLRERGKLAVCLTGARVDHKVSSTICKATSSALNRVYVHYLNRFIHMKLRLGYFLWLPWALVYLPYVVYLLVRVYGQNFKVILSFIVKLICDSIKLNSVDRDFFQRAMGRVTWL